MANNAAQTSSVASADTPSLTKGLALVTCSYISPTALAKDGQLRIHPHTIIKRRLVQEHGMSPNRTASDTAAQIFQTDPALLHYQINFEGKYMRESQPTS